MENKGESSPSSFPLPPKSAELEKDKKTVPETEALELIFPEVVKLTLEVPDKPPPPLMVPLVEKAKSKLPELELGT